MAVIPKTNVPGEIGTQPLGLTSESGTGVSSEIDIPHPALDGCRQYLLLIANEMIGPELQAKFGASDLVQDTFNEAQRHLAGFRGTSSAEMRAWLREILECRLSNVRRAYVATGKRALGARWRSRPCASRRKSRVTFLRVGCHRQAAMQCDRN